MQRSTRRYVEKLEALDFTVGKYQARKLPRIRYHQGDLLEYLDGLEHWAVDDEAD